MNLHRILALTLLAVAFTPVLPAQAPPSVATDPSALVRRAIQNRFDADKHHHPLRYLLRQHNEHRDTTKAIIETKDGDVARLIAENGQPLTPAANQAELARLANLAAHPELQERRRLAELKDAARVNRLMALLPDAMLYRFEALEPCPSGRCFRLSFTPNPRWSPPTFEAGILRGVAGTVWIDQAGERLTRLDARFIADVDFGLGLIGRVYKGGAVTLEQTDIGNRDWELTSLHVDVAAKAFLIKTVNVQIKEDATRFSAVPPMDYKHAIQLLQQSDPSAILTGK